MPTMLITDDVPFTMHGATFRSYVSPSRGSRQLCAWRLELAAGITGLAHTVSDEEVFLVLAGSPTIVLDGLAAPVEIGSVVHVPAGTTLRVDNPADVPATLWVTTVVGLTATTDDGATITPPWTR